METNIVLDKVSLYYKDLKKVTKAVDNISCTLKGPKIYGLIGRNGAGKTSLRSLTAAYRLPTGGRITIDGEGPFENVNLMPDIQFVYSRDVSDETETIKTTLEDCANYRPSFDIDYAYELLGRFKLDEKKGPQ